MIRNIKIADILDETADLLELQNNNTFRIRSYRQAADTIRELKKPVADIVKKNGVRELKKLPGIGSGLAASIKEITETGHLRLLDRLERQLSPERLFCRVPGIGEELAHRIYSNLDIETLPELEMAAHNGRLNKIEGLGRKKIEGIRNALAGLLSRKGLSTYQRNGVEVQNGEQPGVDLILYLDRLYRERAKKNELKKIAPKRFNPEGVKWLPVLNIKREDWNFTFLFSNTARAHELGKTQDWVIVYFDKDDNEGQNTVITAGSGPLKGKRIIPGREKECRDYYEE